MITLTGKQRAYLRSLAMSLSPIFQIGKSGVFDEMADRIDDALEARELIKIHVLDNSPVDAKEAAQLLSEACDAVIIQVIGAKITLFRPSQNKPKIDWKHPQ